MPPTTHSAEGEAQPRQAPLPTARAARPTIAGAAPSRRSRRRRGSASPESLAPALPAGFLDELRDPLQLVVGDLQPFPAEQRRDDLFGRALEKRIDQMLEDRPLHSVPGHGWKVDVAKVFLF